VHLCIPYLLPKTTFQLFSATFKRKHIVYVPIEPMSQVVLHKPQQGQGLIFNQIEFSFLNLKLYIFIYEK